MCWRQMLLLQSDMHQGLDLFPLQFFPQGNQSAGNYDNLSIPVAVMAKSDWTELKVINEPYDFK